MYFFIYFNSFSFFGLCCGRMIPIERGITTTMSTQHTLDIQQEAENDNVDLFNAGDPIMPVDYRNSTNRVIPMTLSSIPSTSITQKTSDLVGFDHVFVEEHRVQHVIPQTQAFSIDNSETTPSSDGQIDSLSDIAVLGNGRMDVIARTVSDREQRTFLATESTSSDSMDIGFGINSTAVDDDNQKFDQVSDLLGTILSQYDPRFRPIHDQLRSVVIRSDFVIINIIDFDTQEQRFSVMGYFRMEWKDELLTWNRRTFGGTRNIRIPVRNVWIPKLTYSMARYGSGLVGHRTSDVALVHHNGIVRWLPEGTYDIVCGVGITFYPFDIQTCTLTYYIADEDRATVELQLSQEADLSEYIENAEWKLVNLTAEEKLVDDMFAVQYTFKVERRAGFTLFTMVIPLAMLSALSGTTFLIPIDSGENCCFAVTVFLSYGIFETIVIATLPENSLNVSYIIIYITCLLACSTLMVFYTIVQSRVFMVMGARVLPKTLCTIFSNKAMTYKTCMRKIDCIVFVVYMTFVIGGTSTFLTIMANRK